MLTYGALIGYTGPPTLILSKNLATATEDPDTIASQLREDLALGRVSPVDSPTQPFISSPLGLVPKADAGWRRIHHLSYPPGRSVNDGIPREFAKLVYDSRSDILNLVRKAGIGATLIKKDLKDAFRMVPVAPQERWLLGFQWEGQYYKENCLPFGLRTAPFLFNMLAEALHWILISLLPQLQLVHYLDDFIAIIPREQQYLIEEFHRIYASVTSFLGLLRNLTKEDEGTTLECLGIEIDTLAMVARLPDRKRAKGRRLVGTALSDGRLTRHDTEVITGFLNFCTEVIPLGRTFLARLYQFEHTFENHHASRPLTAGARADLLWWHDLLPTTDGTRLLQDPTRRIVHLFCDASQQALGGFWYEAAASQAEWHLALPLPQESATAQLWADIEAPLHINIKEVLAIQACFQLWAHTWAHSVVIVHTDSNVALSGLRHGVMHGVSMDRLRDTLLLAAAADISLHALRVTTHDNGLADALSRCDWPKIANWCPHWQTPSLLSRRPTSLAACPS